MQNNSSKNYYYLLRVKQDASPGEIKKSYRRLAMKYHPDKNPGDILAGKIFLDISEAYNTLSDFNKRKAYDYNTFANTGTGSTKKPVISADHIWRESTSLKKIVTKADPFRLNRDALFFSLSALLCDENIYLLQKEGNTDLMLLIIQNIIFCSAFLSMEESVIICNKLLSLSNKQAGLDIMIDSFLLQQKQKHNWEKYKIIVALAASLLFCLLVYFMSKK